MTTHEFKRMMRRGRRHALAREKRVQSWLDALVWGSKIQHWHRRGGLKPKPERSPLELT